MTTSQDEAEAISVAQALYRAGSTIWRQVTADGAEWVRHLIEVRARMAHPMPEDVVVDLATLTSGFDPDRVGILISRRRSDWVIEPWHRRGVELTWPNARFIAVPGRGTGWPG